MTASGENCDIRTYEKYAHILACPPAKKVFWAEFRGTSPSRLILFLKRRYDWMYSFQVYSGLP